ncbi:heteromeric transposase endonuclease subunit TnsA [Thermoanaerobacter wiegelii]|uniref:TnsA endonuclease n=1 Tax=Thermoanaerobacter wiegelii Rt8.B1 TaxID=697303 RepID=G2MTW5_9THEO|nr:heteromeric transposase endonuclease subunit TnsA [Thermoanaerobacter wiegelii]AEM79500.1 TnsA endonuclease [Thermoanaerobacter wiegelii Rt8.B1]
MRNIGKYNTDWSEEKYKRFLKEGRGRGEGKDYKPWLTVQDFPSKGRCHRIFGWKTGRIHHLFTDSEARFFYLLEWEDSVIDIREHFPLLDYGDWVQDREDLRFDLFTDKKSGTTYVISTSFLITVKDHDGNVRYVARSLKAASELEKRISLERLEIERRYWQARGIDWGIVTNKDIPVVKAKNIEWIHSARYAYMDAGLTESELVELGDAFLLRLSQSSESIRKTALEFDKDYGLDPGTGMFLFRHLLAVKRIKVNMDEPIDLNRPAYSVDITDAARKGGKAYAGG